MPATTTDAPMRLANTDARRLFLDRHGLAEDPSKRVAPAELQALIERLGFIQVDSINTVARAHDLILFSRRQCYRPRQLKSLLEKERSLFEHWTHDAAIIPTRFYPHWKMRFERHEADIKEQWRKWRREGFEETAGRRLIRLFPQVGGLHLREGLGAQHRRHGGKGVGGGAADMDRPDLRKIGPPPHQPIPADGDLRTALPAQLDLEQEGPAPRVRHRLGDLCQLLTPLVGKQRYFGSRHGSTPFSSRLWSGFQPA